MAHEFEVLIAGAGPGGCLMARDLARAGLSVGLFDASEADTLGKPIIIEIETAVFEKTGVALPVGDEVPYHARGMRYFSCRRQPAFFIPGEFPAVGVYLDRFSRKLLAEAVAAGAKFFGGRSALRPIIEGGAVRGAVFKSDAGEEEARAKVTVDATGFSAALTRQLPPEMGLEFRDKKSDVVLAENRFHEIDPQKAREAIAKGIAADGEVWNRLSVHGNYSTEYSHLSLANNRAYILVGLKADGGLPSPGEVVDRFREEMGYFGAEVYGGKGPIRVRRSLDQLVADGFMVIGEAACQVIPAHGSGAASAMWAGHLAAKAAMDALKKGDVSTASLWPYCHEYQSGRGAILAAYDTVKLVTESLSRDKIAALFESGAMAQEDIRNGFVPLAPGVSLSSIPGRLKGFITHPELIPVVMKLGRVTSAAGKLYRAYPRAYDPAAVKSWKAKAAALFSPLEMAS